MVAYILYIIYIKVAFKEVFMTDMNQSASDNIYYIGFLFTLISLALALFEYQFAASGSGAGQAEVAASATAEGIRDIVENFGIALFTTIVGLAGRVFLLQFLAPDTVKALPDQLAEAAQAAARLRDRLREAEAAIARAVDEGKAAIGKSSAISLETIEKLSKELSGKAMATVGPAAEELAAAVATLKSAVEASQSTMADAAQTSRAIFGGLAQSSQGVVAAQQEAVAALTERLANASGALGDKLEAAAIPVDGLKDKLGVLSESLSNADAQLNAATRATEEMKEKMLPAADDLSRFSAAFGDSADGLRAQMADAATGIERCSRAVDRMQASVARIETEITRIIDADSFYVLEAMVHAGNDLADPSAQSSQSPGSPQPQQPLRQSGDPDV